MDFGRIFEIGIGKEARIAPVELFWDDEPMELARFPNKGTWAKVRQVRAPSTLQRLMRHINTIS
jgi:hypothetical protein